MSVFADLFRVQNLNTRLSEAPSDLVIKATRATVATGGNTTVDVPFANGERVYALTFPGYTVTSKQIAVDDTNDPVNGDALVVVIGKGNQLSRTGYNV